MPSIRQRIGFVAGLLGMFMAILDIQIVASSLNEIQAGVSATPDEISWVQTAYLIAEVIMIPLSGLLTRWLSTRYTFVISCLSFTAASIGCALAQTIEQLIVLRAIQGFVGGAMIPIVYAMSFSLFPTRVMGIVQALIGMIATTAPSIGPTLGGYITQATSWHWLFLMNVIPGLIAAAGVWFYLDMDKPDFSLFKKIDFLGLFFLIGFLGPLEYILEEGPGDDWFASHHIAGLTLISITSAVLFFWRAFSVDMPIVDLRVFRNRNFAVGSILGFVVGVALFGLVYLMPLFLGGVRHLNSLQIGQIMFVTGLSMFITAPIAGRLSDKVDIRYMLTFGLLMVGTGSLMNANLTADSGFYQFLWPQIVRGIGLLICIFTAARIAMGTLTDAQLGNAAGLFNLMRNLGGAVALAAMDTVRDIRFDYHWNQLIPAVNETRDAVSSQLFQLQHQFEGMVSDPYVLAVKQLASRVATEANVLSFNDMFIALGVIYLCAVPLMLFLRKPEAHDGGAAH
ncbi:DHA2 family efflux MFS transporter permease subunit [Ketobacter sp. MCCC 1A13808]|uniref:DHA2 family efflux MFS transporter permease subunit n=1 Tax=Ketobacter sp. MCCC 1A13808 TaxID=2602738 RepID=UPI000F1D64D7|nr:DHA2 family efflux MFS transporter permease subunit [Ketobacter sp. MCCC 1A13808]MVF11936.1 DHA2 family efflux MFS transporter permease subunit [Ketobacter sp. MCCC 1A13808]RLP52882.1 MAG: DHA2 family efflux MFS transporter permease subunit [Ketobacter sp.]